MADPNLVQNIKASWRQFVDGATITKELVRPEIYDAWTRCRALGVDPWQKLAPLKLKGNELQKHLARHRDLIETSRPVMETLARFVSGSGFVIVLADQGGILLEVLGDAPVMESVKRGNFCPGADWSEAGAGSNGIGTSLTLGRPIQIFGYEHYCRCSHKWTCSGAPIYSPDGVLIGALNMTGSEEKVHPHTLGMVVGAAEAIQNQLKTSHALKAAEVANNYKDAIMESMSEALLAVDQEGTITHVNQAALNIFKIPKEKLLLRKMEEVFGELNRPLLSAVESKTLTDREIDIVTVSGKIRCTVTVRAISSGDGVVVVLNEISRVRKLANRMTGATAKLSFADIVGESDRIREAMRLAKTVAETDSNVLLTGESGTGKDVFAQAIHNASSRRKGPFVAVNCASIPRELIASEFFGYDEGAFTGARKGGNPGKFELAEGGTLFLDEIGEMPLELQAMLLRALEERAITRIGGKEVIPVNVRIITATNKDLRAEVKTGQFRQDLFYRLNVFSIRLPALNERATDLRLLGENFLEKFCAKYGKKLAEIDEEVWQALSTYSWPGNVRELQNLLERLVATSREHKITADLLPDEIKQATKYRQLPAGGNLSVEDFEKNLLLNLLEEHHGNLTQVARAMGIARTTLYRKLNKYGIKSVSI